MSFIPVGLGKSLSGATLSGSVLFTGTNVDLKQDNNNLTWDTVNKCFAVGRPIIPFTGGVRFDVYEGFDDGSGDAVRIHGLKSSTTNYAVLNVNDAVQYVRLGYFNGSGLQSIFLNGTSLYFGSGGFVTPGASFDIAGNLRTSKGITTNALTLSTAGVGITFGDGSVQTTASSGGSDPLTLNKGITANAGTFTFLRATTENIDTSTVNLGLTTNALTISVVGGAITFGDGSRQTTAATTADPLTINKGITTNALTSTSFISTPSLVPASGGILALSTPNASPAKDITLTGGNGTGIFDTGANIILTSGTDGIISAPSGSVIFKKGSTTIGRFGDSSGDLNLTTNYSGYLYAGNITNTGNIKVLPSGTSGTVVGLFTPAGLTVTGVVQTSNGLCSTSLVLTGSETVSGTLATSKGISTNALTSTYLNSTSVTGASAVFTNVVRASGGEIDVQNSGSATVVLLTYDISGAGTVQINDSNGNPFYFFSPDLDSYIKTSGNFGLGTTTPAFPLDVAIKANFSKGITANATTSTFLRATTENIDTSTINFGITANAVTLSNLLGFIAFGDGTRQTTAATSASDPLTINKGITANAGTFTFLRATTENIDTSTVNKGITSNALTTTTLAVTGTTALTGVLTATTSGACFSTIVANSESLSGPLTVNGLFSANVGLTTPALTISQFTAGSVPYVGLGGIVQQDNSNLFWDSTNKRLGLDNAAPAFTLDVTGTGRTTNGLCSTTLVLTQTAAVTGTIAGATFANVNGLSTSALIMPVGAAQGYGIIADPTGTGTWQPVFTDTGWALVNEVWTFATSTTFTVPGDKTGRYQTGDRIRMVQSGTTKYFYCIGATFNNPNTTVTVTAGDSFTIANAAISSPAFSRVANPQGFPFWFPFTTTFAGFSANPTPSTLQFQIVGRQVTMYYYPTATGTSNASTFTMTAPITSKNLTAGASGVGPWVSAAGAIDAGAATATPAIAEIGPNTTTIQLFKTFALGTWTATLGKGAWFMLAYEIP